MYSHFPSRGETWSNRKIITVTENNIFNQRSRIRRRRRRRPCLRSLTTTLACNRESFILYFNSETARTNSFLGYFAHIVGREGD